MKLCKLRDRISEFILQLADELPRRGLRSTVFNVSGTPGDNNQQIYAAYKRSLKR